MGNRLRFNPRAITWAIGLAILLGGVVVASAPTYYGSINTAASGSWTAHQIPTGQYACTDSAHVLVACSTIANPSPGPGFFPIVSGGIPVTALTGSRCLRSASTTALAEATTDCITGLTAGTGITTGSGTTPSVALSHGDYVDLTSAQTIAGAKTFSTSVAAASLTDSGLLSAACTGTNGAGLFVSVACITGGGSGVSSATAPVTFTSGVIACPTCLVGLTAGTGISTGSGTSPSVALSHGDYVSLSPGSAQTGSTNLTGSGTFAGGIVTSSGDFTGFLQAQAGLDVSGTNATIEKSGTATGGGNFASFKLRLASSLWNGSAAVTHNWDLLNDTNGYLVAQYDGTTEFTVAPDSATQTAGAGAITANAFFQVSRRAAKDDILPLEIDGLQTLRDTDLATWHYKKAFGDPTVARIGYIADDSPAVLAGEHHDHFDAGALATVDAKAILELDERLQTLENAVWALLLWCLGLTGLVIVLWRRRA